MIRSQKRAAVAAPTGEAVWEQIAELAAQLNLAAGDALPPVRELGERLKLKPSVVRDALMRAQGRGLVRILPRVGAFLQGPGAAAGVASDVFESLLPQALRTMLSRGDQNVLHLLDARRLIEIELIGRAAERRQVEDLLPARQALEAMLNLSTDAPRPEHVAHDVRFHIELAKLAGNRVLASVQQLLMELLQPYLDGVPAGLERRTLTDRSHAAIYSAVVDGDAARARSAMREHLSLAYDSLLHDLRKTPAVTASTAARGKK